MPFARKRPLIILNQEERAYLEGLSHSRTEAAQRVERSKIILLYSDGVSVSAIARQLQTNRPKIERCIDKVLQLGAWVALQDLPRKGKPASITKEARTWVVSLACQKPKDFGYSYELWTTKLLSNHIKANCEEAGYSCLNKISCGTVSKILTKNKIRPHKIKYYLEKRDPDFDVKMEQVLYVYKEAEMLRYKDQKDYSVDILSYDEKPGIQAIENRALDLAPVPGSEPCIARA